MDAPRAHLTSQCIGGQAMTTDNVLVAGDDYGRKHLATQWDWRNVSGRNYITPSQDQGACQASTAFAITATGNKMAHIVCVEAGVWIAFGNT